MFLNLLVLIVLADTGRKDAPHRAPAALDRAIAAKEIFPIFGENHDGARNEAADSKSDGDRQDGAIERPSNQAARQGADSGAE